MSIEAMKQALEALIDLTNEMKDQDFVNQGMDAITALRTAIEQAENQEPVACVQDLDEVKRKHLVYEKGMDWKDPLYTTPPAAPVQEPVTDAQKRAAFERFWVTEIGDKDDLTYGGLGYAIHRVAVAWEAWKAAAHVQEPDWSICPACGGMASDPIVPQAQRQWVGLTDEEKADLFEGTAPYYNETDYADAIEAKLREKNGGQA